MHDSVISETLERAARKIPDHPLIECVVHEQVRQDGRNDSPNAIANFEFEVALAYRRGERIWGSRKYRSTTKRDAKGSI